VLIPGINSFDYSALGRNSSLEVIFLQPNFREGYESGRIRYLPLTYSSAVQYYAHGPRIDLCLLQTSPPNNKGDYSLGTSADFAPSALANCRQVAIHVNPAMPFTNGPWLPADRVDFVLEAESALLQHPASATSDALRQVAAHVGQLIEPGDTIQLGLGKLPQAVCQHLAGRRRLRVHSGMISDPLLPLLEDGAVEDVVTGTAIGTDALYRRCTDSRIRFASVAHTHAAQTLSKLGPLKCINAVMQVDLLGQGNSEWLGGRQVAGCGGLMDFGRGCRQHPKGAFILAMPSTAKGGRVSTIVPRLPADAGVSIARQDIDYLVTEHGIADLRYRDSRERAKALIDIAHPAFREDLLRTWSDDIAPRI
jgi:acyl-CoA hydrolase